jgi:hypothetical protein
LNFVKSGEKVIFVKSSPVWSLILGSEALDMLLPQTCKIKIIIEHRLKKFKNRKQTIWKCVTVQVFGNDSNKSKFDSGGNQEEIEFW